MIARKLTFALSALVLTQFAPSGLSSVQDTLPAPVDKVLVPVGLSDQDQIELTLTGVFPNTCYRVSTADARIDHDAQVIRLRVEAEASRGVFCAQVLTRFISRIQVGPLPEGTYEIVVLGRAGLEIEPLVIDGGGTSHESPLFAPVERATLSRADDGSPQVEIAGAYPFTFVGCLTLDNIDTSLLPGSVVLVEPHAVFTEGERCLPQRDKKDYMASEKINANLTPGAYLLQVRTMNGLNLMRVFHIDE